MSRRACGWIVRILGAATSPIVWLGTYWLVVHATVANGYPSAFGWVTGFFFSMAAAIIWLVGTSAYGVHLQK